MGQRQEAPAERGRVLWEELPGPALSTILESINNPTDFFSFSSVCRAWRDFAVFRRAGFFRSLPPVLFFLREKRFYNPVDGRFFGPDRWSPPWFRMVEDRVGFCGVTDGARLILSVPVVFPVTAFRDSIRNVVVLDVATGTETARFWSNEREIKVALAVGAPVPIVCAFRRRGPLLPDTYVTLLGPPPASWTMVQLPWRGCEENRLVHGGKFVCAMPDGEYVHFIDPNPSEPLVCMVPGIPPDVHHRVRLSRMAATAGGGDIFGIFWVENENDDENEEQLAWAGRCYCSLPSRRFRLLSARGIARTVLMRLDVAGEAWRCVDTLDGRALFMDLENGTCFLVEQPTRWGYKGNSVYSFFEDVGLQRWKLKDAGLLREKEHYAFRGAGGGAWPLRLVLDYFWVLPSVLFNF